MRCGGLSAASDSCNGSLPWVSGTTHQPGLPHLSVQPAGQWFGYCPAFFGRCITPRASPAGPVMYPAGVTYEGTRASPDTAFGQLLWQPPLSTGSALIASPR